MWGFFSVVTVHANGMENPLINNLCEVFEEVPT